MFDDKQTHSAMDFERVLLEAGRRDDSAPRGADKWGEFAARIAVVSGSIAPLSGVHVVGHEGVSPPHEGVSPPHEGALSSSESALSPGALPKGAVPNSSVPDALLGSTTGPAGAGAAGTGMTGTGMTGTGGVVAGLGGSTWLAKWLFLAGIGLAGAGIGGAIVFVGTTGAIAGGAFADSAPAESREGTLKGKAPEQYSKREALSKATEQGASSLPLGSDEKTNSQQAAQDVQAPQVQAGSVQTGRVQASKPPTAKDLTPQESTLGDEARLLDWAHRASAARALDLVRDFHRDFPQSALAADAEIVAMKALRELGEEVRLNERALAFLARFPGDPHEQRVRRWLEQ